MSKRFVLNAVLLATLLSVVPLAHADLQALWRFDTGGTSQSDSTSNGNTATSVNGAVWQFDGARSSGTMFFDGADDFLQAADSASLSITGDMTIALWVYMIAPGGFGQYRGLVSKDPAGSGTPAPYQFWFNQNSPTPGFGRGDGTNQDFAFGSAVAPGGVWRHWAVSMSGTTVTMYLNGATIGMSDSLISTTIADQNGPLLIGDRPGAQDMSFYGQLDDVAIFDQALSQGQVQTIMTGDFTAFGIPEPGAAALVVLGTLLLGVRRSRR